MAVIHVLDQHTAELIAAGEVVERPASVVKELAENAIDAGATAITVMIEHGGVSCIQIADNGTGIDAEYIPTAFIRHATSKIATQEDLESIHTLGFRGEALASVASVAHIELLTRTEADEYACLYRISGGVEEGLEAAARPVGTTITVRDLFYNTPARMKFLKKDVSEANYVSDVVTHLALSHPEVSFKFIREGKVQFQTSGDGKLRGAAYAALSRDFAQDLVDVDYTEGAYAVTGCVTPPKSGRASRAMQFFFINGRYVKNRTMMAAIEAAYKGMLMQGKYPGCVLTLTMPAHLVDVNVHPAKTEVRFAREKEVFDLVYKAVKSVLLTPQSAERTFAFTTKNDSALPDGATGSDNELKKTMLETASLLPQTKDVVMQNNVAERQVQQSAAFNREDGGDFQRTQTGDAQANVNGQSNPGDTKLGAANSIKSPKEGAQRSFTPVCARPVDIYPPEVRPVPHAVNLQGELNTTLAEEAAIPYQTAPQQPAVEENMLQKGLRSALHTVEDTVETSMQPVQQLEMLADGEDQQRTPLRFVGEVFDTYIITQRDHDVCFIDKHAAHERLLYESLAANYGNVSSQMLLCPVSVQLSADEKNALLQHEALLAESGVEVEDFGGTAVVVRAVPADVVPEDVENLVIELANRLVHNPRGTTSEKTEWVLHSIACRAAIKAGDKTHAAQLMKLAEDVLDGKIPPFCPHGRPVILKVTKKELEKQFGRQG